MSFTWPKSIGEPPTLAGDAYDANSSDGTWPSGFTTSLVGGAANASAYAFLPMTRIQEGVYRLAPGETRDVDATLIGTKWTHSALSFSFPTDRTAYISEGPYQSATGTEPSGFQIFNQAQQSVARYALDLIASYTGLAFTEIAETSTQHATLRFANTRDPHVESAQAGFPTGSNGAGDVWFGRTGQPFYLTPAVGNWGAATIMHEIGHAMGLKHGHQNYRNEDLSDELRFAGTLYGTSALTPEHDGQAWSLMTYSAAPGQSSAFYGEGFNQPQTYMQVDIAALQSLYGANFDCHPEDTIYRWNPRTGTLSVNGVAGPQPTSNKVFMTVWDGDGIDTYDLSAYRTDLKIDLRPGEFSTFNLQQVANTTATLGTYHPAPGNVANALLHQEDPRSLIENAIGGAGNDTFIGNQAHNQFVMNGGNDTAYLGDAGGRAYGGSGDDTLFGGNLADLLRGDSGNDWLSGFGGNDKLFGGVGNDTLVGGTGIDSFVVDSGTDRVTDLGLGGSETLQVRQDAIAEVTLGGAWSASAATRNDGTVTLTTDGLSVNLVRVAEGSHGFDLHDIGTRGTLLIGSKFADAIFGGTGDDRLQGGDGNDVLLGQEGRDVVSGGAGSDLFQFAALADLGLGQSADIVRDFTSLSVATEATAADKIDFSAIDTKQGGADDAFALVGAPVAPEALGWDGTVWVTSHRAGTWVNLSLDADSDAEFQLILTGLAPTALQAADFVL